MNEVKKKSVRKRIKEKENIRNKKTIRKKVHAEESRKSMKRNTEQSKKDNKLVCIWKGIEEKEENEKEERIRCRRKQNT